MKNKPKYPKFLKLQLVVGDSYFNSAGKEILILGVHEDGEVTVTSSTYTGNYRIVARNIRHFLSIGYYTNFKPSKKREKNENKETNRKTKEESSEPWRDWESGGEDRNPCSEIILEASDYEKRTNLATPNGQVGTAIRLQVAVGKIRSGKVNSNYQVSKRRSRTKISESEVFSGEIRFSRVY